MDNFSKAMLIPVDGSCGPVVFQWNPPFVKHTRDAKWIKMKSAGNDMPQLQYTCGDPTKFSFEFDVSRYNNSDFFVKGFADNLMDMTLASKGPGAAVQRPPKVTFVMGQFIRKNVVVEHVEIIYGQLFNPSSLLPYLAKVKIVLKELPYGG